ncbi:hypothetical protein [Treponema pectinovorum]|uniref:hypothetical protein n=1 Tax=Treponema pectinovorum TaxID=164 RepID=UPI0011C8F208|nr:hypothetical protein [Treponema pectinovorum]
MSEEKKYTGYGYHGGGRKKLSESGRKQLQLSLQQEEIDFLKESAKNANLPVSRFVMECVKAFTQE